MGIPNTTERCTLMNVALGKEKADLVIAGGDLVDVYSGEILKGYSVAVKGERVASIAEKLDHTIGPETKVINASGKTIIPGLVDGHTHLTGTPTYYTPYEFLRYAMKGGNTTIITETMEMAFVQGYSGLVELLEALKNQPIKFFATVPAVNTLSEELKQRAVDIESLSRLMQCPMVVGIGETYWQTVTQENERFWELSSRALELGKTLEGHAAGAQKEKLTAYLCSGISSCHESINSEEALEKLRQGIFVMMREGSVRKDLEAISRLKDEKIDFRRLVLVTDDVGPQELIEKGYMEFVVQKAIDLGFEPVTAIQMATLNPAEHFHLDGFLGGIAPGRYADILIIPDHRTIQPEYVISNGKLIAHRGELLLEPRKFNFSRGSVGSFRRIAAVDLAISTKTKRQAKIRVINQVTGLVTKEFLADLPILDGEIKADPAQDILKAALLSSGGRIFTGFIKGFGLSQGAIATSAPWDACAIVSVGAAGEDIAGAVNRVIDLGGGIAVYSNNKIQAELPLPIAGILSDLPLETIVQKLQEIQKKLGELGCFLLDPILTLATIATPAIPFLRLSEDGLVDVKSGKVVDLIID